MPSSSSPSSPARSTFFFFTPRGAFFVSIALFFLLIIIYVDLQPAATVYDQSAITNRDEFKDHQKIEENEKKLYRYEDPENDAKSEAKHNKKTNQHLRNGGNPDDVDGEDIHGHNIIKNKDKKNGDEESELKLDHKYRRNRLIEESRRPLDPNIQEWPFEDPEADGALYNVSTTSSLLSSSQKKFISKLEWKGKCWYRVTNFCLVKGDLVLYHEGDKEPNAKGGSLRMCNEFSQRSPSIRLKYRSEPTPKQLPGPLLTKTPGWVTQFWCQDLFHSTLSILPAFHTKKYLYQLSNGEKNDRELGELLKKNENEPDLWLKIARGKRHKGGYCYIKFGHPLSFNESHNDKWSKGKQFPFNGNPYWSMYKVLSGEPWRIHPQYGGATQKTACYKTGIIDKLYIKDMTRKQAREYSDAQLVNLLGDGWKSKTKKRECKKYRVTIIDRRGKTRKLTNIPEIIKIAKSIPGYADVRSAQFEFLTLQQQISLIVDTDLLLGVHGNGLIWQQFLQHGSCLVELVHTWYQPYAKLFGHSYFHSSIKNNPYYKEHGEFVPFAHNETEIEDILRKAKSALDSTSCDASELEGEGVKPKVFDMDERLDYMYKECAPHC